MTAAPSEPPAVDSPTAVTCNAHGTTGCAVCFGRRSAPSPVDVTEPPAVPDLMGALRRSVCRHLTWDVNTETGTAHCARCGVPWADTQPLAEARCSENGCWYTLPVVDGLIVSHSAPMTLDNCEGSGKPPAETQQDDETGVCPECGVNGFMHRPNCRVLPYLRAALAARPSADTETLRRVREVADWLRNSDSVECVAAAGRIRAALDTR